MSRPKRTRVKICGITRPEDGISAATAGADAIGLVFYAKSPRHVTPQQAHAIISSLPPFVTTVGLFVDASREEIEGVLREVPLDTLQFHGEETPDFCALFGRPYLKAIAMREGVDLHGEVRRFSSASALLVDTFQAGVPGGTGVSFDWARLPADLSKPLILAGGLNPDNVAQAIIQAHPYAVDVSSGVEAAKGIKDADKIAAFMRGVVKADVE
ncbi:MAG TPA: phosphoribosylanthranilate isomerase [Gammaproteobacteria bacterium]